MSTIALPERYPYEFNARSDMEVLIGFQEEVDRRLEEMHGKPVEWRARDSFRVMRDGDAFVIVFDDPSLP